jgi:hypothetical protein
MAEGSFRFHHSHAAGHAARRICNAGETRGFYRLGLDIE